jgi:hypothetical protein
MLTPNSNNAAKVKNNIPQNGGGENDGDNNGGPDDGDGPV